MGREGLWASDFAVVVVTGNIIFHPTNMRGFEIIRRICMLEVRVLGLGQRRNPIEVMNIAGW